MPTNVLTQKSIASFPLSWGRVLLLGIAQRQIRVSRSPLPPGHCRRKPLPTSIQTLGYFIQVRRYEKRLPLWQLAQKMGITTASVQAWEEGTSQPDGQQMALLTKYLRFELANILSI
jgi:ribosome-binding protein aMBF1 (putative translation factor)